MIPFLDFLSPLISKALDFIPDPKMKAEAQQKITEEMNRHSEELLKALSSIDTAQIGVNQEEAKSSNLFISGWRPFLGWVGGLALTWQYILQPITTYILTVNGHKVDLPVFDFSTMSTILMAILGMGGLRTWEKVSGVSGEHN